MSQEKILNEKDLLELKCLSIEVRKDIIKMISNASSGHPGGSLSAVEIMVTLYSKCMKHFPDWKKNPEWKNRDRFVLSKGHASATLYAILAEFGYIEKEELMTFRQFGSRLQGHPSCCLLPGVEVSTGSLGQGLSMACGMAMGLKLDKINANVFALMGDGELQEGQIWEAAMSACHYNLGNLIAFVDKNGLQIDGCTEKIMSLGKIDKKFESFGWNTLCVDGHDHQELYQAIEKAKQIGTETSKPTVIVAKTIKGKDISFMENNASWHGTPPSSEQCELALAELKQNSEEMKDA